MSPTARVSCCLHPLLTPSPLQAEVQRVQLQQAVHKMEMALEDPVKGGENVMTYKQYWDQYSGQMEKLRTENPMMHHLLQVLHLRPAPCALRPAPCALHLHLSALPE